MAVLHLDQIPTLREFPKTCTPVAPVTADDNTWNGSGDAPVSLTTACVRFDVSINQPAFLVFSASTTEPTADGCWFAAGHHTFRVTSPTYLHYKNASAGDNVTVGVNCWAEGG